MRRLTIKKIAKGGMYEKTSSYCWSGFKKDLSIVVDRIQRVGLYSGVILFENNVRVLEWLHDDAKDAIADADKIRKARDSWFAKEVIL